MSWNPNKSPLEINNVTVNNKSRLKDLAHLAPKFEDYPQAPINPVDSVPTSNESPNQIQEGSELGDKKASINRALQQRRDDDNVIDNSVTLYNIDEAILTYMQNDLNIQVKDNGNIIKVPVIYGSPERWQSALKDGYLRDKQGQLQNPIVMVRRSGFQRNDQLMTFNRHLSETFVRKFSEKNRYDKFHVMNSAGQSSGMVPVNEVYNVVCPDQILVNYECAVWTDLHEQMNTIIERINFAAEEYWGDKKRFKFRVRISDFSNTVEVQVDDDRLVRSDFTLEVWGYLLPDTFENFKATTTKSLTPRKVVFGIETSVADNDIFSVNLGKSTNKVSVAPSGISSEELKESLFKYQGEQTTIYGSFVFKDSTKTTIKFLNKKLSPTPQALINSILPANKFSIFVDGVNVPKSNIASFSQVGSDFVVKITNAGFTKNISSSSEIFSIGKFE